MTPEQIESAKSKYSEQEIKDMQEIRNALAKRLGKNIVNI